MIAAPRWLGRQFSQIACAVLLLAGPIAAQPLHAFGASLESQSQPLIEAHRGKAAVAAKHRDTGESFARPDASIPLHSFQTSGEICVPVAVPVQADDTAAR